MITIDLLDATWAVDPAQPGPIVSALSVDVQERIDEIPSFTVSVPVSDTYALARLVVGRRIAIYIDNDRVMEGIIKTRAVAATQEPTITITGPHRLYDVTRLNTWLNWSIDDEPIFTAVGGLLAGTGWNAAVIGTPPNVSGLYSGLSRWASILNIVERVHLHARLDYANPLYLTIGAFGDDSGVVLAGPTPSTPELFANEDVVPLESLEFVEDSWEVYNRILPLGAGDGDGQLTVERAAGLIASGRIHVRAQEGRGNTTLALGVVATTTIIDVSDISHFKVGDRIFIGDPTRLFRLNPAHPDYQPWEINYVVDINVNTLYLATGVFFNYAALDTSVIAAPQFIVNAVPVPSQAEAREATMAWKEIAPVDLTDLALEQASLQLYYAARSELERRSVPLVTYRTRGLQVKKPLRVGDKARLMYVGAVKKDGLIADYINVNELFWVMGLTRRWAGSGESSVDLEISSIDTTARNDVQSTVDSFMTGQTWQTSTQVVAMRYNEFQFRWVEFAHPADFFLDLDDGILSLESCVLNLRTRDSSPPSGGTFPAGVHLYINSADCSSQFGGPWVGGGTTGLDEEFDLTEILNRQAGGFKRRHHFQITCSSGDGEAVLVFKIQAHVRATRELHV